MEKVTVPSSWLPYAQCPPPSLAPGEWPAGVYAGRLTIYGHRVPLDRLPKAEK